MKDKKETPEDKEYRETTERGATLSLKEKTKLLTNARTTIIQNDNSMAGISLYAEFVIYDKGEVGTGTDGHTVWYDDWFFGLKSAREQVAVVVHELLHIAFRHAQRRGTRHPRLWNIAVDAIVNSGLAQFTKWMSLPADCVTFEKIVEPDIRRAKPDAEWTSEAVYDYLLQKAKERQQQRGKGQEQLDGQGQYDSNGQRQNGKPKEKHQSLDDAIDQMLAEMEAKFPSSGKDLRTPIKEENGDLEDRKWEQRLNRAISQGKTDNSVLGKFEKEFPRSETPWEALLRQYMRTACLPKTQDNWGRPGRHMLSTGTKIFSPNVKPQNGLQRAIVIVDTSGSIYSNPGILEAFAAEVTAIQKQTGCTIELIYADTRVTAQHTILNDGKSFIQKISEGKYIPVGGGGTDMRVPIAYAKKLKPAVCIVLSDGETPFPYPSDVKGLNLIWVITTDIVSPVGKTIKLKLSKP